MKKIVVGSAMIIGAYIGAWFGIIRAFELIGKGLEGMVARKEENK